jgi:two-component system sensor histidine kinase KdpD
VVAQITGVIVRETVPDSILDVANEVELVDLPPDELLQRLREGKVYIPERAAQAMREFFRKGNLTALRELSLRRTAVRVDEQMRDYMATRAIPGPWPAAERLLVCVGPGPLAERLVRAGRRMADQLDAEWFAIYVETHRHAGLSEGERDRVARILRMAEELGATTTRLPGNSIADTATQYAHQHNITKILMPSRSTRAGSSGSADQWSPTSSARAAASTSTSSARRHASRRTPTPSGHAGSHPGKTTPRRR